MDEAQKWQKRYERARDARQAAEKLLEEKSLALYRKTCQLDELVAQQKELINERTRDFEQANAQAVMLSDAIRHTQNGVIITGSNNTVIWANAAVEKLTGFTLEEMQGIAPGQLLQGPDTDPEVRQYMREHIDARQAFDAEVLNYNKEGKPYWIHLQVTPILDEAGAFKYFVAIQSDITAEKETKEKLDKEIRRANEMALKAEEANAAKTKFLATMSHELRTPLNGIIGYSQILENSQSLEDTELNQIRVIRRSSEHLLTLINDLLDISKIEAGGYTLTPDRFDLMGMIYSVSEIIRSKAEEKNLPLRRQYETNGHLPEGTFTQVTADSRALRQVLLNLLGNAIKFTDKGMVSLETELLETRNGTGIFRFAVTDTGRGIPADKRSKLFEPYKQIDAKRDTIQGTGLGLFIAQKLVQKMGGNIEIKSTLGQGSSFYFTVEMPIEFIPLNSQDKDAPLTRGLSEFPIGFIGKRRQILVVDDIQDNRDLLNDLLKPIGFEVELANNGRDALRKIQENHYDLVLSDVIMPFMSGYELVEALRKDPKLSQTTILAVSASLMQLSPMEKSRIKLFDGFISKPIQASELFDALHLKLNLEWIYKSTVSEKPKSEELPSSAGATKKPENSIIESLLKAAEIGDIKRLRLLLPEIENSHPELYQKINNNARIFKLERINEILKAEIMKEARNG